MNDLELAILRKEFLRYCNGRVTTVKRFIDFCQKNQLFDKINYLDAMKIIYLNMRPISIITWSYLVNNGDYLKERYNNPSTKKMNLLN